MGQALYRQYRPKNLDQVTGQDHITTTLKNALKNGKISHAYLFTGPRGVGKTSIARILAYEVNQFDYASGETQLDIIEIDAASNRRIDEIRDLRDKVHIAPASGKYKVYIIDEVHMLTKEAFNALLKTLEEPPAHVIFILATTESHKLPETIISRTQRFSFKPIEKNQIISHLQNVAGQEKIRIDKESLELIAEHSDGSFRDALSLLDQASSNNQTVNTEMVKQLLGIAPKDMLDNLIEALSESKPQAIVENLLKLDEQGYQAASIAKQLSEALRQQLVDETNQLEASAILNLLKKLLDVPASTSPDKLLEVILLDAAFNTNVSDQVKVVDKSVVKISPPPKPKLESIDNVILSDSEESNFEMQTDSSTSLHLPTGQAGSIHDDKTKDTFSIEQWPHFLDNIKSNHNTLYGILRMSQPSYENGVLTLNFKFAFHQKRIGEPKMLQHINETFENMGLQPVKIVAVVSTQATPPASRTQPAVDMAAISNIFGDAEVLES